MKISVDTTISKPKEDVWRAITDIEHCASMISNIDEVVILNKPDIGVVGLKWRETRQMFGKEATETMWITDAVDNEYYQVRAENHGVIYISTLTVREKDGGTQLTMSFAGNAQSFFAKVMMTLMGFFIKKSMTKVVSKDLEDIKEFVEITQVQR